MNFFNHKTGKPLSPTDNPPVETYSSEAQLQKHTAQKRVLQTKTYIFPLAKSSDGTADDVVNRFCANHNVLSICFDRAQDKLITRVLYSL